MKRKVLALFTALFMLLSFTGCSKEGLSLSKELQKTATYEALQQTGTFSVDVTADNQTMKFLTTYDAYTDNKSQQGEMTLNLKSVEVAGKQIDLTKGQYKISPVKMYVDESKMYVATSFIKEIAALTKQELPKTFDFSKAYIALDASESIKASGIQGKDALATKKAACTMLEGLKVELPIKQEGRKYTIALTSDQMVDTLFAYTFEMLNANMATLKATYKAQGMTDEQINQVVTMLPTFNSPEIKNEVKTAIKGSTAKMVMDFTDDKYTNDTEMAFVVNAEGQKVTFNIKVNDNTVKAAKKALTLPKDVKVYTTNELQQLIVASVTAPAATAPAVPATTK